MSSLLGLEVPEESRPRAADPCTEVAGRDKQKAEIPSAARCLGQADKKNRDCFSARESRQEARIPFLLLPPRSLLRFKGEMLCPEMGSRLGKVVMLSELVGSQLLLPLDGICFHFWAADNAGKEGRQGHMHSMPTHPPPSSLLLSQACMEKPLKRLLGTPCLEVCLQHVPVLFPLAVTSSPAVAKLEIEHFLWESRVGHPPTCNIWSWEGDGCHRQSLNASNSGFSEDAGICVAIFPFDGEDFLEASFVIPLQAAGCQATVALLGGQM